MENLFLHLPKQPFPVQIHLGTQSETKCDFDLFQPFDSCVHTSPCDHLPKALPWDEKALLSVIKAHIDGFLKNKEDACS
ncbi:hypothetical protein D3C86_1243670 [compost metagenome]